MNFEILMVAFLFGGGSLVLAFLFFVSFLEIDFKSTQRGIAYILCTSSFCAFTFLAGCFIVVDNLRQQSFLQELDRRGIAVGEKTVRQVIEQCRPYYKNDSYIYDDKDGNEQESGRYEYLKKAADERMIPPGCYKCEDKGVIFITHSVYYYTPAEIVEDALRAIEFNFFGFGGGYDSNTAREAQNRGQTYFGDAGTCADEKLVSEYKKNPDIRWAFEVHDALQELDWLCKNARGNKSAWWKARQVREECLQKFSVLEAKIEKILQNRRMTPPTAQEIEVINKLQKSHF